MSTISYADLRAQLLREIWTFPGEAKSQVASHKKFFLEALIDLCKWVDCLQSNHTDVHPACSTYVECGKTLFDAPYGVVKRVYTIPNDDWCNKVFYSSGTYQEVECWARNLLSTFKQPDNTNLPALQQGYRYADASSDSTCGRARVGKWAIHRRRFYLIPWVQSNESVVIEWDGVKTNWQDGDLLDLDYWSADVQAAIKLFMQWSHERDFGTDPAYRSEMRADYEAARADLIFWCRERTKQQIEECGCDTPDRIATSAELQEEVVQPTAAQVFAGLGDFGNDSSFELAVSNLIRSWNPIFIVTTGDNYYGPGNTGVSLTDLDTMVGKYYHDFLFPYIGTFGSGALTQKLFVAIGNHDRDPVGRLALEAQYFNIPSNYYDFVVGPVHCFILDTGYDNTQVNQEFDGVDQNSVQAQWLRAKLALSTAKFKLVFMHHPPFSSTKSAILVPPLAADGTISFPALQWPFKTWGADAVIFGHVHNYERLVGPDGMLYIANGAGGASGQIANEPAIYADPPLPISVFRYNLDFGAQRFVFDCNTLTMEFWNRVGVLIDSVVITK